jgi:phage tail-like protein
MDANGLRFWMLADDKHWPERSNTRWNSGCRALELASFRSLPAIADPTGMFAQANSALERIPRSIDPFGAVAYWDEEAQAIVASSHLPDSAVVLPVEETPTDICVGVDGVLYVAVAGGVLMHDLRGRWADVLVVPDGVAEGEFTPWRLAAAFPSGVWVLDRLTGRFGRLNGKPLPSQTPQPDDYSPEVFRPDPENCRTPQLRVLEDPAWPGGERPVAFSAHPEGGLAFLSWSGGDQTQLRRWDAEAQRLQAPLKLNGAHYAYALEWLDAAHVVVRMPRRSDAPAFAWKGGAGADHREALGEVYPIAADGIEAPFVHRVSGPPHYPVGGGGARPLYAHSLPNLAREGNASNYSGGGHDLRAHLIDSGSTTTVWHRLYAEAAIPARTGFTVWLAATNEPQPPALSDVLSWHPHGFGRDIASLDTAFRAPQLPRAAWEHTASELPCHPGLAPWPNIAETQGLYSVLIQNACQRTRALQGRYLWVRVKLFGDGRAGPRVAALRAYASRFSFVEQYLPRVYRETLFGKAARAPGELLDGIELDHLDALNASSPDAPIADAALRARLQLAIPGLGEAPVAAVEQPGHAWLLQESTGRRSWRLRHDSNAIGIYRPQASRADFLSRMLASFEGVLTQFEDRIGAAHLFSDPDATPEPHLDWLANWIGVAFDPALPVAHRREWLRSAEALALWHGTRRGLELALNIATGDGVRQGKVIVIEDFRLRRILATLLGVDLGDELDPLLPGLVQSANSIVGDALVLGEQERVELLALFREEVATDAENAQVLKFLGQLANRATVLVHVQTGSQDLGLIRRIVELESPAHVEVRVVTVSWPLMVGVYSLVGVDTFLGPPRRALQAQLDRSALGLGDYLIGPGAIDPRMRGAATPPPGARPVADAGPDASVGFGQSFDLDGSASRAAPGREISKYVWRRMPPDIT